MNPGSSAGTLAGGTGGGLIVRVVHLVVLGVDALDRLVRCTLGAARAGGREHQDGGAGERGGEAADTIVEFPHGIHPGGARGVLERHWWSRLAHSATGVPGRPRRIVSESSDSENAGLIPRGRGVGPICSGFLASGGAKTCAGGAELYNPTTHELPGDPDYDFCDLGPSPVSNRRCWTSSIARRKSTESITIPRRSSALSC